MSNAKPTPTPWFTRGDESVYGPDGVIARTNIGVGGIKRNVANAAYIANAVNSYDALKALNEELLDALRLCSGLLRARSYAVGDDEDMLYACHIADAAIAKAKGKSNAPKK